MSKSLTFQSLTLPYYYFPRVERLRRRLRVEPRAEYRGVRRRLHHHATDAEMQSPSGAICASRATCASSTCLTDFFFVITVFAKGVLLIAKMSQNANGHSYEAL